MRQPAGTSVRAGYTAVKAAADGMMEAAAGGICGSAQRLRRTAAGLEGADEDAAADARAIGGSLGQPGLSAAPVGRVSGPRGVRIASDWIRSHCRR